MSAFESILHAAVQAMSDNSALRQDIATLGELRAALAELPADMPVVMDGGESPAELSSYRGYYERLSISTERHRDDYTTELHGGGAGFDGSPYMGWYQPGASEVTIAEPVTASEMVKALNLADGEQFEGYKGGQYEMHAGTFLHAASYGSTGLAVFGIRLDGDRCVITTGEYDA